MSSAHLPISGFTSCELLLTCLLLALPACPFFLCFSFVSFAHSPLAGSTSCELRLACLLLAVPACLFRLLFICELCSLAFSGSTSCELLLTCLLLAFASLPFQFCFVSVLLCATAFCWFLQLWAFVHLLFAGLSSSPISVIVFFAFCLIWFYFFRGFGPIQCCLVFLWFLLYLPLRFYLPCCPYYTIYAFSRGGVFWFVF